MCRTGARRPPRPTSWPGRIDFLFTSYISIGEAAKGGKLRIVAIGGPKRIDAEPNIPTMAEAGYPGLDLEMWHGMVAPAGTPAPIVNKLNAEFIKATRDPQILRIVEPQATDVFLTSPGGFCQADRRRHPAPGQVHPRRRHQGEVAPPNDRPRALEAPDLARGLDDQLSFRFSSSS